ncbi:uncharacterized protein PHALS_10667 [Plasmopara halstedii]|uniref:Uncharacterized protein n=1 Tax=Plasmopara halstedii TaxID=4781 RepID=A0A0P1AH16_PLAHL|nr:uncharacterized protein PHALS_10667 [Plasmopara halstedii]CEG40470.1 hypothetical protein PHALS_10667 [Plasmopara halstedii]|eukprot:XP_024576839.1 hypothetical protein PHALS_10667 [Plasmopara halstedii]
MGNKLVAGHERMSLASRVAKSKRQSQSRVSVRHLTSPMSPTLQHVQQKHRKRRSRSQSEGVTSDCSTAISTNDSLVPRTSNVSDKVPRHSSPLDPTTEEEEHVDSMSTSNRNDRDQPTTDQLRRIHEAEKILLEIAKEYAAKRAAGLVPTKPVPARTLLWEEMERRAQRARARIGKRGTCVFGRDSEAGNCGCSRYKKAKILPDGREVCACCHHGAPWHRLAGGTMSGNSRGDEEEEEIAKEVAKPYHMMHPSTLPLLHTHSRSEGDNTLDVLSNTDNFGLPPRLSSTSRHLDKLLSAIAKYRAMGFSEDEIEQKIRQDFPPTERLSNNGNTPRRLRAKSR